jgi:hypothetical protein
MRTSRLVLHWFRSAWADRLVFAVLDREWHSEAT